MKNYTAKVEWERKSMKLVISRLKSFQTSRDLGSIKTLDKEPKCLENKKECLGGQ